MEHKSDEQLLADHIAGVQGAFDSLVARYADEVYGFLCRFAGNKTIADDLLQETFMQVHLAARTFDPRRSFRPWLYTIAANKARDYMRARGRRPTYSLDSALGDDDSAAPSQNIEAPLEPSSAVVEAEEQRAAVREVLDRLPEHLRLILTLGYFQQLPYAEIATILDVPVGTVKSRLHSAVRHFARLWQERMQDESIVERERKA